VAHIDVIDQISLGGFRDKANEDRLGFAAGHAWVIDGATGLGDPFMGQGSDAAWLAQRTHERFMAQAACADPRDLLAAAADDLVEAFAAERRRVPEQAWELPCGAFMLASAVAGGVRLSWTGDCRAIVQPQGGPLMCFGATALSEEDEAAQVSRFGEGGDAAQRYRQPEALAALREGRAVALAPGNTLILAPDRSFLDHLRQAEVSGGTVDLLLMTDGFAAAELRYGLFDGPAALLAAVRRSGLAEIGRELRRFEHETDPDGRLKPRWKRSDDATALWLRFVP
jgi:hypothetical protein